MNLVFKNIEQVWAWLKQHKPESVAISKIEKIGQVKAFEMTIPKAAVKKWPKDVSGFELVYTISEAQHELSMFCEETNDEWSDLESNDFKDLFQFLSLKEAFEDKSLMECLYKVITKQ